MEALKSCSVQELKRFLDQRAITILDVREYPEWVAAHIQGSQLSPLSALRQDPSQAPSDGEVFLLCRSGRRAAEAAALLQGRGSATPIVVEGGIEAWRAAGYEVASRKGPISLERQVRIGAGLLIMAGLLVPGLWLLPYFVGAGLLFAGITDKCGMALLLARLPWNRMRHEDRVAPCQL